MATYAGSRQKVHDALIIPWRRTTENWNDQSCHDELLSLAAQHDAFAWLAGQYSGREKDAVRDRAVERLRKAAEAKLFACASQPLARGPGSYRSAKTVIAMLVAVMVLGLVLASLLAYVMPHGKDDAEVAPSAVPASQATSQPTSSVPTPSAP